jgi:hypothetical protein
MAWELRPVDLEFLADAPVRLECAEVVPHGAAAIWAAFALDPAGWGRWFPGFSTKGRYLHPAPHGVGSYREVWMGGVRYCESIIGWEEPARFAFSVIEAGAPIGQALAEDYRIIPFEEQRSVVEWTFATEPKSAMKPMLPVMRTMMPVVFRKAMRNLSRCLAEPAEPEQTGLEQAGPAETEPAEAEPADR